MPITSSAKKAHRASLKKQVFNLHRKETMKAIVKKIKTLVHEDKKDEAIQLLPKAYQAIDKAKKRRVIKNNKASRDKSRLSALFRR